MELADAEASVGVDSAVEASSIAGIVRVTWSPITAFVDLELTVEEPEAFTEEAVEGCPDPIVVIKSQVAGLVSSGDNFEGSVEGVAVFDAEGTVLTLGGDLASVGELILDMISAEGYGLSSDESYWTEIGGGVDGGTMAIGVDLGEEGEESVISGDWQPAG